MGTWSKTSAGHYDWAAYWNDPDAASRQIGTGIVSGDTLTLPNIEIGDGEMATFTFTRITLFYSSSDPLLGCWDLAWIYDGEEGWQTAGLYEISAQMAIHDE